MFAIDKFIEYVQKRNGGDYPLSFKLLGFMVYVIAVGNDKFLSGELVSPRTYHRWMNMIHEAGWVDLFADHKLREIVKGHISINLKTLPPEQAYEKVLEIVKEIIDESKTPSLKAIRRQESEAVKGEKIEALCFEAKPKTLDSDANGGSLQRATAGFAWIDRPLSRFETLVYVSEYLFKGVDVGVYLTSRLWSPLKT